MSARRRLAIAAALAAFPLLARAGQDAKPRRVGAILEYTPEQVAARRVPIQAPFVEGLQEYGWVEGKNVEILFRAKEQLDELLRIPVDVLVAFAGTEEEVKQVPQAMPVVMLFGSTFHTKAFAKSLAHPGGNVTGISPEAQSELATKRLALLKEAAGVKRVARFYPVEPAHIGGADELAPVYRETAQQLGLEIFAVFAPKPADVRASLAAVANGPKLGLSVITFSRMLPGFEETWDTLLEEIARRRMPAMFDSTRSVMQGGLMSYGEDPLARARRLAYFVDKILRGAKAGDIPIEQSSTFEFVINMKAAEAIGLKIPDAVMLQATRVIR